MKDYKMTSIIITSTILIRRMLGTSIPHTYISQPLIDNITYFIQNAMNHIVIDIDSYKSSLELMTFATKSYTALYFAFYHLNDTTISIVDRIANASHEINSIYYLYSDFEF